MLIVEGGKNMLGILGAIGIVAGVFGGTLGLAYGIVKLNDVTKDL